MDITVDELLARAEHMEAERATTASHWQQVADYMIPSREFMRRSQPGQKRNALIFNTTPVLALEQLAGGLHGMLTSPSLRWFAIRPVDSQTDLLNDRDAKMWFDTVTGLMYDHFTSQEAGFDTAMHENYLDIAGFGTSALYMPDDIDGGPRYDARALNECFFSVNAQGQVDTLHRMYLEKAREVLRLWPTTCPAAVREMAAKRPDDTVKMLHATWPTKDPAKERRWQTAYLLRDQRAVLEDKSYRSFPFAIARWSKRSGETYGYGPGMNALPDVMLLNKLEEVNLRGLAKVIDPPMMVPDDGFLNTVTTQPGGLNTYRADTIKKDDVFPLPSGARPDIGDKKIEQVEDRVRNIFYTTWMNLPQQPNMTATEVLQRRDEMLRLLGPMVARMTRELLAPVIARTFEVMAVNNKLPPPPQSVAQASYKVEYLGPLALAQRSAEADLVLRWIGATGQMAQAKPEVADRIDGDAVVTFLAERYGVPAKLIASDDTVKQIRDDRAKQQQAMLAAEAAAKFGAAAKDGAGAAQAVQGMQQGGQPQPQGVPA